MVRRSVWATVWAPLSLALIGAVLEKEGHEVKLSDCIVEEIGREELLKLAAEFKPGLVVLNTATPSIVNDLSICHALKTILPSVSTAAIGIHPTVLPDECFALQPGLDYAVRGEPEMAVKDLARALAENKGPAGIAGLSYRSGPSVKHEADRKPLENLDELPFPAWNLTETSNYVLPFTGKPFVLVMTGRGCPCSCKFCAASSFYGKKMRVRSAKSIVDELEWVKKKYGISEFLFWGESFTMNQKYAVSVAREILDRKLNVSWVCNSRVDNVSYEMFKLFHDSGCWMVSFGVESGSQEILDKMKKGIKLDQIRKAVGDAHEAGLEVVGHVMIGYPGETEATVESTINFVKSLPMDFAQFYCTTPFPGSELYEEAKKNGWITTGDWSGFEQGSSVLTTENLTASDVVRLKKLAYFRYYFSPAMAWRILRRVTSFKNFVRLIPSLRGFIHLRSHR